MDCKKIRELILTDYSDGELTGKLKEEVESHLGTCAGCGRLLTSLRTHASDPLRRTRRANVPDALWQKIRDAIELEKETQPRGLYVFVQGLLARLRYSPRFGLATAFVLALLFMAAVFARMPLRSQETVNSYLKEEMGFLANLKAESRTDSQNILGTGIEEAFL